MTIVLKGNLRSRQIVNKNDSHDRSRAAETEMITVLKGNLHSRQIANNNDSRNKWRTAEAEMITGNSGVEIITMKEAATGGDKNNSL